MHLVHVASLIVDLRPAVAVREYLWRVGHFGVALSHAADEIHAAGRVICLHVDHSLTPFQIAKIANTVGSAKSARMNSCIVSFMM